MSSSRRPRLYFSFRSPYSWLTVRRLRQRAPDAFEAIDWIPYWDPDVRTEARLKERGAEFHYVQMSRAKHFYLLTDTKRLAATEGVPMAWPVDVDPWWELPHLAWLRARREGLAEPFYDAVTAARWERGEDICTPAVVRAAAEQAGLDPDAAAAAPDDADVREEGVGCLVSAYEDDIFGIPYLRWGRHRFWGLDRLETFLAVWGATDSVPKIGPAPALVTAYDHDTAGGCG
jgi:2-hydroxychromene-2-carboxylate isomerase